VSAGRSALCAQRLGCILVLLGTVVIAFLPSRIHVAGYITAPVMAIVAWRCWTAGIHIEAAGVKVVGILLSKRFSWGEIDHFAVLPFGTNPYVGHCILRSGRSVPCLGISAAANPETERRRRQVEKPIDKLNRTLEAWRASGDLDSPIVS
jgi:hypothetical protein